MNKLNFDKKLFKKFSESFNNSEIKPSKYWEDYVDMILQEIDKDQLDGFGTSYNLTRGFGDAMNFPARYRIRRLLKLPYIYLPIEKFLALRKQAKQIKDTFDPIKHFFTQAEFIDNFSSELHQITNNLGINRYILVNQNKVPWRYLQFFAYIELIIKLSNNNNISINEIFEGNTLDIGGGYAPVTDGIGAYKAYKNIGNNSTNYILDQYPVSYIANQYLSYRHNSKLLTPIVNLDDTNSLEKTKGQYYRVIQSTVSKKLKGLNVKLFFNSNSFQEMDSEQIYNYVKFMKDNKDKSSYLICFFYSGFAERNSPKTALEIFQSEFQLIGNQNFELQGLVSGDMYLYQI